MLSATALMNATSFVMSVMSPSKCARVRIVVPSANAALNTTCFRYDPYAWRALPSPAKAVISPEHPKKAVVVAQAITPVQSAYTIGSTLSLAHANVASPVPQANRLLYSSVVAAEVLKPAPIDNSIPRKRTLNVPEEVIAAPSNVPRYAIVSFKHDSSTYIAPFKISVGDMVFVEGDRGEDLGTVTEVTTTKPVYNVPCKVLRRAAPKERDAFSAKQDKEAATTAACQALADSLALHIEICDTEFQFDGNKLTVYFLSKSNHIDFRKLQRGLFREHRCRIWLSNMAEVEYQKKLPRSR